MCTFNAISFIFVIFHIFYWLIALSAAIQCSHSITDGLFQCLFFFCSLVNDRWLCANNDNNDDSNEKYFCEKTFKIRFSLIEASKFQSSLHWKRGGEKERENTGNIFAWLGNATTKSTSIIINFILNIMNTTTFFFVRLWNIIKRIIKSLKEKENARNNNKNINNEPAKSKTKKAKP